MKINSDEIQVLWDALDTYEDLVDPTEDKDQLELAKKLKLRLQNLTVRFNSVEKYCEECGELGVIIDTVYGACEDCVEDSAFHE